MGVITVGTGRTTVLQGGVRLVIFAAFLFLAVVPKGNRLAMLQSSARCWPEGLLRRRQLDRLNDRHGREAVQRIVAESGRAALCRPNNESGRSVR